VKRRKAGVGVYYKSLGEFEHYKLARQEPDTNHAELAAIFIAVLNSPRRGEIDLFTDSQNAINFISRGTSHPKFSVLRDCTRWLMDRRHCKMYIRKVKGHSGDPGNTFADKIAGSGILQKEIILPDDIYMKRSIPDSYIEAVIKDCIDINRFERKLR